VCDGARARQRLKIDPVRVRFLAEGQEAVGRLTEVSRAGVFVEADEFPRPGAVVAFQFRVPSGELVDVRGEVRWSTQGLAGSNNHRGFGIMVHEAPLAFREFVSWIQNGADEADKEESEEL
jgi:hypothetical protein